MAPSSLELLGSTGRPPPPGCVWPHPAAALWHGTCLLLQCLPPGSWAHRRHIIWVAMHTRHIIWLAHMPLRYGLPPQGLPPPGLAPRGCCCFMWLPALLAVLMPAQDRQQHWPLHPMACTLPACLQCCSTIMACPLKAWPLKAAAAATAASCGCFSKAPPLDCVGLVVVGGWVGVGGGVCVGHWRRVAVALRGPLAGLVSRWQLADMLLSTSHEAAEARAA